MFNIFGIFRFNNKAIKFSSYQVILIVSIFLTTFYNRTLFAKFIAAYPVSVSNFLYMLSLAVLLVCIFAFIFALLCHRYTARPVFISVFFVSSLVAYFMDEYSVIINDDMIHNLINTDIREQTDLVTLKMMAYVFFLGVIPSIFIYKIDILYGSLKKEILSRSVLLVSLVTLFFLVVYTLSSFYFSFLRQHKTLRQYINPAYYSYSAVKYASSYFSSPSEFTQIGLDARISRSSNRRKLMVMVVGEAARFDRFSVNGYERETNPILKTKNIVSLSNAWSCGTSTADSLPCMFSSYDRDEYDRGVVKSTENVLDILKRAGVNVLWLDNNSDSKGVASRVESADFRRPVGNSVCDVECRDEGMLPVAQDYIDSKAKGDILIVLHQMGSHGPAYYKRYPAEYEKFTPTCKTNLLHNCSQVELDNTYDNTILYTDYFLGKLIDLLKLYSVDYLTSMIYVSDHGESLGEGGLYLHGLPYSVAPDAQKHIPMILWFGQNIDRKYIDVGLLKKRSDEIYSHDNIFHTLLGMFEVSTLVYKPEMDIFRPSE